MRAHRNDRLARICFTLLFSGGLILTLFPALGTLLFDRQSSEAAVAYASFAEDQQNTQRLADMQDAACSYNETLLEYERTTGASGIQGVNTTVFPGLADQVYQENLNADGSGLMGTIFIPSIGVELPILHGTSTEALSRGAGHLEGTSLPVGGKGTHSVITGHSGLVTQRMFTDLEKLQQGDRFYVKTGEDTLIYKVDQIRAIDPYDVSGLGIDPDHDFVTLMTCTPYGLNTERLIVRGERVAEGFETVDFISDTSVPTLSEWGFELYYPVLLVAVGVLAVLAAVFLIKGRGRT